MTANKAKGLLGSGFKARPSSMDRRGGSANKGSTEEVNELKGSWIEAKSRSVLSINKRFVEESFATDIVF